MSQPITGAERTRIAGEAICCERTVRRVYDGAGNHWSRARVTAAAERLGLPLPPEPEPADAAEREAA